MKVTLWGTRGSVPTPGPQTVRYGGNTSCVEVRVRPDTVVVLDAGTGIRPLGAALDCQVRRVDIFLSHLHLDHIQGLGFFAPLSHPDVEVHVWGLASSAQALDARLSRYLSPPLFPVRLRDRSCELTLHAVKPGPFELPGIAVRAGLVRHRGSALGYRLTDPRGSLAYVPDHELDMARVQRSSRRLGAVEELVGDVDVLIHDAQYSAQEYPEHRGWGHSSITDAARFATSAGAKRLVGFHHDPAHEDSFIDRLVESVARMQPRLDVVAAVEGSTFDVGASAASAAA